MHGRIVVTREALPAGSPVDTCLLGHTAADSTGARTPARRNAQSSIRRAAWTPARRGKHPLIRPDARDNIPSMDSLFRAVREACSPEAWSRGVEMTRREAVLGVADDADEVVLRVLPGGRGPAVTVTLFLQDDDWDCTCGDDDEACAHVAAAAIAWRRAVTTGETLPAESETVGRLEYRFVQRNGALAFRRVLVVGGGERPLEGSLRRLRESDPTAAALVKREDMQVERALGRPGRGPLPPQLLPDLFRALVRCEHVLLDGRPVQVDSRPLTSRICVNDQGDGFLLFLAPDPSVTRAFRDGIVLCGDTLRLQVPPPLTAREREDLERGISFGADRVGELVSDVLPRLQGRLPIDIETRRLPERATSTPRLVIDVVEDDAALSVLPILVYGDPPVARIENDRLVHLGGAVPVRRRELERLLEREVMAELGLSVGARALFRGEEAVSFAARLDAWHGEVRGSALSLFDLAPPLRARFDVTPDGFRLDFLSESSSPGRTARVATAGAVLHASS